MIITGNYVTAANIEMTNTVPVPAYYFEPPILTTVQRNGMVGGWGLTDEGKMWFNRDTLQWEMWVGREAIILG